MSNDAPVRPMSWRQALKRLDTGERNDVVTKSVIAAGEGDKEVLGVMLTPMAVCRNFGEVSAYELAFRLYVFLEERGELDLLERKE